VRSPTPPAARAACCEVVGSTGGAGRCSPVSLAAAVNAVDSAGCSAGGHIVDSAKSALGSPLMPADRGEVTVVAPRQHAQLMDAGSRVLTRRRALTEGCGSSAPVDAKLESSSSAVRTFSGWLDEAQVEPSRVRPHQCKSALQRAWSEQSGNTSIQLLECSSCDQYASSQRGSAVLGDRSMLPEHQ
jgi:hypothetical protein